MCSLVNGWNKEGGRVGEGEEEESKKESRS